MLEKFRTYISSLIKPERVMMGEMMSADTWLYPHSAPSPYNPDQLASRKGGLVIYDKMRKDDTIKACLGLKKYAILSSGWNIEPAISDKEDNGDVADFVQSNFDLMKGSFDDILLQMMTSFEFGFSVTEKIFAIDNNKVILKALKTRKPHGIDFETDKFGNLLENGVIQARYDRFPSKKFMIFVNNPEFNNWYGESDLKACYRSWWSKDNIIKFWNMYLERYGMPPVIGKIESPLLNEKADTEKLQNILKRLQTATSALIPSGVDIQFLETKGKGTVSYKDAVNQHDMAMARALLVPSLLGVSAQGDTGSYSQSKTHFNVFLWIILRLRRSLEELINEELIKELVNYNFRVEEYPAFRFLPLDDEKKIEIAKLWIEAVSKGTVTPDKEDENLLRSILGWPEKEIDEEVEEPIIPVESKEEIEPNEDVQEYGGKGSGRYPLGSGGKEDSLKQEALKHKTADEFVAAQISTVDKRLVSDLLSDMEYLKNNKLGARINIDDLLGRTDQDIIDLGMFIREAKTKIKDIVDIVSIEPKLKMLIDKTTVDLLKILKYDKSVYTPDGQTKAQLIDIWNEAHAKNNNYSNEILFNNIQQYARGNWGHKGRPGQIGGSSSSGFVAMVGERQDLQAEIKSRGLKVPPVWKDVKLNEDPTAAMQVKGIDTKGRTVYIFSAEHSKQAGAEKFERLKQFNKEYPVLRNRISRDFVRSDEAKVMELISETGLRIGSNVDTKAAKKAYGASTLERRHVKITGDNIELAFPAKKGVFVKTSLKNRKLANYINTIKEGPIFKTDANKIRDYLEDIDGDFKVKDFRTRKGTATALQAVKEIKGKMPRKKAIAYVSEKVAKVLGNTPAVAKSAYIAPEVWDIL